ncbi:MAG: hypothetical protein JNJ83_01505 [Verrucomicrobiaceae bacterium]|nr:hypothetical protein [Verrucomicrobiaceae bacterium]
MIAARPISEVQCDPHSSSSRRYRSWHRRFSLFVTAAIILLGAAGLVFFVVCGARTVALESRADGIKALGGFVLFALSKVFGGWMTRQLTCHLCHGPVLKDRGCHKHQHAFKLPGLSYRISAALSIVFALRFRCMYCGTGYRLKK